MIIKNTIKMLTEPKELKLDITWEMLTAINKKHKEKPTRETLELRRLLRGYFFNTSDKYNRDIRKRNISNQETIKELTDIAAKLPTLYQALTKQGLKTTKLYADYYRGDIGDCSAWGISRGSMTSQFYRFYCKDLSLSYSPPSIADFLSEYKEVLSVEHFTEQVDTK